MTHWTDEFVERCLADIPRNSYRRRTERELRDHLISLAQSLEGTGMSPEEARTGALERMGRTERLREAYRDAWLRTPQAGARRAAVIAGGCVLMGGVYLVTAWLLSALGFTTDAVFLRPTSLTGLNFPLLGGDRLALTLFGSLLFLVTFVSGALFLRFCFRGERRPAAWVTLGLVAAWAGEKGAILLLSALIYDMPLGLELLHRISRGGDVTGPWFTPAYILLTLVGCLVLGQVSGRPAARGKNGPECV